MKKILIYILLLFCLFACTKEQEIQKLVVQGFLCPNQPVEIKLSILSTIGDYAETPVNGALVQITHNDYIYTLTEIENSGKYTSKELQIWENNNYQLFVSYNGMSCSAETTIPLKPLFLEASFDTLVVPQVNYSQLLLNWMKNSDFVCITLDYIDNDSINDFISNYTTETDYSPYYFVHPYQYESINFSATDFKYYGRNVIKVYGINEELKELYDYHEQYKFDTPPIETNVVNGLGIFTGISYDSVLVVVKR